MPFLRISNNSGTSSHIILRRQQHSVTETAYLLQTHFLLLPTSSNSADIRHNNISKSSQGAKDHTHLQSRNLKIPMTSLSRSSRPSKKQPYFKKIPREHPASWTRGRVGRYICYYPDASRKSQSSRCTVNLHFLLESLKNSEEMLAAPRISTCSNDWHWILHSSVSKLRHHPRFSRTSMGQSRRIAMIGSRDKSSVSRKDDRIDSSSK